MPAKILFVDPTAGSKPYVDSLLKAGYTVDTSSSGLQALPKVRIEKPDLIISEITLPQLNGLDMIRSIKETPTTAKTKILVFSSMADQEIQEEARDLGALEFLPKNAYSPEALVSEVKKYLP